MAPPGAKIYCGAKPGGFSASIAVIFLNSPVYGAVPRPPTVEEIYFAIAAGIGNVTLPLAAGGRPRDLAHLSDEAVVAPIVITGPARSGTSMRRLR